MESDECIVKAMITHVTAPQDGTHEETKSTAVMSAVPSYGTKDTREYYK